MNRRAFLGALAGGALTLRADKQPWNIVLILADDLGWKDLGCYGGRFAATPNLDKLASQGARFTNAYAACPVCSPSRAAILTGRHPVRTGVTDWIPGRPSDPRGPIVTPATAKELKLAETTIPEALKRARYKSASVGKWHLGGADFYPTEQGFDLNVGGNHSGSPPPNAKRGSSYFGPFELPGLSSASESDCLTEMLTDRAAGYIRDNANSPFFLYLSHYSPHIPLQARPEWLARHKDASGRYNATYAAMVESVDTSVGGVMRALDDAKIAERTLLLFFSDNGGLRFEGKSKDFVTDNSPLRAGKGHLYEGGIREPLIARAPKLARPGAVIDTPVCGIDLMPTACEFAGVPKPAAIDGVSLLPVLRGDRLAPRPLYWHYPHYSNQGGEPGSAIRDGDWKLIEFFADGKRELYNLADDPGETKDLSSSRNDIAARLYSKLDAWRKEAGAVIPTKNPSADPSWPGFGLTGAQRAL
jgi:arylsulfatase A-like enzyme